MKKQERKNLELKKDSSLEEMYIAFFSSPLVYILERNNNPLEQPSIYQNVDTVTTYGAYEKPVSCQIGITS